MVSAEIKERYELVKERIQAMASEDSVNSKYKEYFDSLTKFILYNIDLYENNCYRDASMEKLQEVNCIKIILYYLLLCKTTVLR